MEMINLYNFLRVYVSDRVYKERVFYSLAT